MRKGLLVVALLLLLGGTAGAEVQVFLLPESGFLRVHGEVIMNPMDPSPSFILFPTAQVTELWADGLVEYTTQRSVHGVVVSMSLREANPQALHFAYEGFLDLSGTEPFLDRSSLWFPEFSFPVEATNINVVLPTGWTPPLWRSQLPMYPAFAVLDPDAAMDELEVPHVPVPVIDEFASRLQMQVSRLTNAINHRNATEIEALLSPTLRETNLARYLASVPVAHGSVSSELRDNTTIIFSTERGFRYQASALWQERSGRLELQSFRLKPLGAQVPQELLDSVTIFVQDLHRAVEQSTSEELLAFLSPDIAQGQRSVMEFLLNLDTNVPWSVEHVVLDPFTITVFVPNSEGSNTKLLLHMGLTPGEHHWLIRLLEVIPVG